MKYIAGLITALILVGCTSPITQPIAQRSLVEDNFIVTKSPINAPYLSVIVNAFEGQTVQFEGQSIVLNKRYNSAAGTLCLSHIWLESGVEKLTCQNKTDSTWYEPKSVLSSFNQADGDGE